MAAWYVEHLGFRIVRALVDPPHTHFIADDAGVMLELYANGEVAPVDFGKFHPLQAHLAMVSAGAEVDRERLVAAGAVFVEEIRTTDGSHLVMLRDPWGLPLQLCRRGKPLAG